MLVLSSADLPYCLAVSFLKILQLPLVLCTQALRLGAQGNLHAALAVPTQLSIPAGFRSKWRLAVAVVVLPWTISRPSADLRRAVQRLISFSIILLIGVSFGKGDT